MKTTVSQEQRQELEGSSLAIGWKGENKLWANQMRHLNGCAQ